MRLERAVAIVACVASVASVGAGCGGDESTVSPTVEWADGFCTAITSWTNALEEVTGELSDPSSLSQEGLEAAASDVGAATRQLVDDLRSLGAPETESGEETEQALDELATTLEDDLTGIEDAAEGVSSLTDLPSAITSITAAFASMGTAFASTLQTIESGDAKGELEDAFEQAGTCDELAGSSTD